MGGDDAGSVQEEWEALRVAESAFGATDSRTLARVEALATDLVGRRNEPTEAIRLIDMYLALGPETGSDAAATVRLLLARASVLCAQGRASECREYLDRAWEGAESATSGPVRADVLLASARWELDLGSPAETLRLIAEARTYVDGPDFDEEIWGIRTLPFAFDALLLTKDLAAARVALDHLGSALFGSDADSGVDRGAEQGRYILARYTASYLSQAGDAAGALAQRQQAHDLCHRVAPSGSRPCLQAGQELAAMFAQTGDISSARETIVRTLAIAEAWVRPDDPLITSLQMDLAWFAWAAGDVAGARVLLQDVATSRAMALRKSMVSASDEGRLRAGADFRPTTDLYLSLFDQPADASRAYELVVASKGLSAASTLALEGVWRDSRDPRVGEIAHNFVQTKAALATARLAGAPEAASLAALADRLGRQLIRVSTRDAPVMLSAPNLTSVCRAVPSGATFVDYVRYQRSRPGLEPGAAYAAFVVDPVKCTVRRVELGPAGPIDTASRDFRAALAAGRAGADGTQEHGRRLRALVWEPVASLAATAPVVVAPDGSLGVVPFGALSAADGRFLIEERHVNVVESAFDLFRAGHVFPTENTKALLVGGIAYGSNPRAASRGRGCGPPAGFAPLAATDAEAQEVGTHLTNAGVDRIVFLRGEDATEPAVRAAMPGSTFVHFATHGFSTDCAHLAGASPRDRESRISAGLALAGANSLAGAAAAADGLLMAEEVAQLDLRGVRVAVLSACETGLGDVQDGDGVIGLRRAFATAGADTLVVSLWNVEDEPTRELMVLFYDAMTRDNVGPSQAFRAAQLTLLERNRRRFGEPRAYTWAAFEALGGIR